MNDKVCSTALSILLRYLPRMRLADLLRPGQVVIPFRCARRERLPALVRNPCSVVCLILFFCAGASGSDFCRRREVLLAAGCHDK